MKFGARDAKKSQPEYDFLLEEDTIEFVQALTMAGSDKQPVNDLTEAERKRMTIDETRKSLPIFPFRESLLQAIKDHQVTRAVISRSVKRGWSIRLTWPFEFRFYLILHFFRVGADH